MSKSKKIWLSCGLTIVALFVLLVIIVGWYGIGMLVFPDGLEGSRYERVEKGRFKGADAGIWLDSLLDKGGLRDTFILIGKRKMHALYAQAPEPTTRTAFIIHGWTSNAPGMLQIGYMYNHDLGYNIFLPDLNGHGKSGGKGAQMGWKDRLDCLEWIKVANDLFSRGGNETQMVVHGISMGAATTMCISGEQTPSCVKAFVEDCGYTTVWDEVLDDQKDLPLARAFVTMVDWTCRIRFGWGLKEASPLNQVAKCDLPMLFIHGDNDTFVPTWMVYPLYEAKRGEKQLYISPGSKHANSYWDHPEEYTTTVRDFLSPHIH